MNAFRPLVVTIAIAAGLAAGWAFAQRLLGRYRTDLFNPRPLKRHVALGYLAGRPSPETMHLLRDYLAWERHPLLRRRAARLMRDLELALG